MALIRLHQEWWLSNLKAAGQDDLEARIRAQIDQEVIDLTADDIINFYLPELRQQAPLPAIDPNSNITGY